VSELVRDRAQTADVLDSAVSAVRAWCDGAPAVDTHARAVADLAVDIARELGLTAPARFAVAAGALLHDVGKSLLDQRILQKPGPLEDGERRHVQTHPEEGARSLPSAVPDEVRSVVRFHHERWDGDGYPTGIARASIPLEARIVAVADAFQAMLEDRPYRGRRSLDAAIGEVVRSAGTQFDPECVQAFTRVAADRRPALRLLPAAGDDARSRVIRRLFRRG
jgi:putative nucleotidyltransferase with HDIG domain